MFCTRDGGLISLWILAIKLMDVHNEKRVRRRRGGQREGDEQRLLRERDVYYPGSE